MSNASMTTRVAYKHLNKEASVEGPVVKVFEKYWDGLHDMEYALGQVAHEYDEASSYQDGPAVKQALYMVQALKLAIKQLEHFSMSVMGDLAVEEAKFIKNFGSPADYTDEQRHKMFPR